MDNNFNSKDILDDRDTDLEVMLEGIGKSLLSKIPIIGVLYFLKAMIFISHTKMIGWQKKL